MKFQSFKYRFRGMNNYYMILVALKLRDCFENISSCALQFFFAHRKTSEHEKNLVTTLPPPLPSWFSCADAFSHTSPPIFLSPSLPVLLTPGSEFDRIEVGSSGRTPQAQSQKPCRSAGSEKPSSLHSYGRDPMLRSRGK